MEEASESTVLDKKVTIVGTNNRYLMKKVTKSPQIIQKRKGMEQYNLSQEEYSFEYQLRLIQAMYKNENNNVIMDDIIQSQLNKKLTGYKSQDIIKKVYNPEEFITYQNVMKELYESNMVCHYCCQQMFILYELVREQKQWTLDRINNDLGHTSDNVVVSCLECNLQRRRTNKDAFSFTKNLIITRESHE
jgi:hypothetical protein